MRNGHQYRHLRALDCDGVRVESGEGGLKRCWCSTAIGSMFSLVNAAGAAGPAHGDGLEACSGSGAVQRELAQLEAAELVTVRRVGNQKHYQANASAPIFKELRGLVLKTSGLVDVLRAALAPLAAQIDQAFIYGSVAKGKDTAKSDIDLMIISEKVAYADLFAALEPATNRLQRTVNPTLYSSIEIDKRILDDNAFVKRVMAQPKLWVIGEGRGLAA
jgi:predicted nucleotidyltransferase